MARQTRSPPATPTTKDAQLKFRMPVALRNRLQAGAEERGRGLSEEIRRRLEGSFGVDADPTTRELTEAIKLVAQTAQGWHRYPDDFARFKAAVELLLSQFQPWGEVDPADCATIEQEGHMLAGVALGALSLPFKTGVRPAGASRNAKTAGGKGDKL